MSHLRGLVVFSFGLSGWFAGVCGAGTVAPWVSDLGNGTYQNPVLHADYSDPDAVRVGEDYWMVASSFSHVPGLPLLHSKDLVNWELVAHALPRLVPEDVFSVPQHGKGVWAPAIRFHADKYWIYYPDPDFGIYLVTAAEPHGPWTAPVLVKGGRGLIDPCPLWDDDGREPDQGTGRAVRFEGAVLPLVLGDRGGLSISPSTSTTSASVCNAGSASPSAWS